MSGVVSGVEQKNTPLYATFPKTQAKEKTLQTVDLQGFERRSRDLNPGTV